MRSSPLWVSIVFILLSFLAGCSDDDSQSSPSAKGGGSGGTSSADGGSGGSGGEGGFAPAQTHIGEGTYYDADGSGNCSFDPSPDDLMVAAMNHDDYQASLVCGACIHIGGPTGSVVVRIVDQCPGCPQGDVDMSPQAFEQVAELEAGRVPIEWYIVPCDVTGPIVYRFKEGSNEWWNAIQVRNIRYAVVKLEVNVEGTYQDIPREDYNYFVQSGLGPGPYDIRVTDIMGHVLEDTGIPFREAQEVPGASQFPE